MSSETETKTCEVHPFEKAGLGKAPFRYIGIMHQEISYGKRVIGNIGGVDIVTTPGGTCDACGQYIVDMYRIKSSDGQVSIVGCDCIKKVGYVVEALPKFKADLAKLAKTKRAIAKSKEEARILEARKLFLATETMFADQPHPTKWGTEQGKTLRDYVEWMLCHAGHSGKFSVTKMIEKEAK
jgi:hypothetical protein